MNGLHYFYSRIFPGRYSGYLVENLRLLASLLPEIMCCLCFYFCCKQPFGNDIPDVLIEATSVCLDFGLTPTQIDG